MAVRVDGAREGGGLDLTVGAVVASGRGRGEGDVAVEGGEEVS